MSNHRSDGVSEGAICERPVVGIIVLTWNGWDDTIECLRSLSVMKKEMADIVIYVIDNCSDACAPSGFTSEFPHVQLIRTSENVGYAGGNNVGIRRAISDRCSFVLLLNNDTIVDQQMLDRLLAPMLSDERVGMTAPKILFYDSPTLIQYAGGRTSLSTGNTWRRGYGERDSGQYDMTECTGFCMGAAILIRCSLLETIGLLDEGFFMYQEDADLSLKALRAGATVLYVGTATLMHKESAAAGGYMNAYSFYYATRNKFSLVLRHASTIEKCLFTVYMAGFFWIGVAGYSIIKRRPDIATAFVLAVLAHFRGETGRSSRADSLRRPRT